MSYIPYSYAPLGKDGKKSFGFAVPTGGVSYKKGEDYRTKCALLSNFDIACDGIETRKNMICEKQSLGYEGEFHGAVSVPFNGRIVFHAGSCLYSYSGNGGDIAILSDTLPDSKSLFCEFMSKLYIYCEKRVFSLDTEFVFSEQMPEAALIFENVSPVSCYGREETSTSYNLVAPRVIVTYNSSVMPIDVPAGYAYDLPRAVDTSRPVEVYVDDVMLDSSHFRVSETGVVVYTASKVKPTSRVKVVFFIKDGEKTSYDNSLYGCNKTVAFGGNTNGGTRIFFTGNADKKGYYYRSGVQNPLLVRSDEVEIIGNGSENVTAVIKMYGNLIVFTEKSVFLMKHNVTSDMVYYSVKEISCETGCDCPDSVQLIDNRVVFANSKKGVFIVDSADETGEHNIKPLSENIATGEGKGLLECERQALKSSKSIDFDRKYMLFVGTKAFIWDYNASPFYDSGNYSKAQERLCWYIYEDLHEGLCYETEEGIVLFDTKEKSFYGFSLGDGGRENFYAKSHAEDFGMPCAQKHVTNMEIVLFAKECDQVVLSLYGDGKRYFEKRIFTHVGKKNHIIIDCPPEKLYDFSFEISGKGRVKVQNIIAKYRIL